MPIWGKYGNVMTEMSVAGELQLALRLKLILNQRALFSKIGECELRPFPCQPIQRANDQLVRQKKS
ncbi:hypothetical protein PRIPAC_89211 [Pristionchus pacificus]|uniref:Uncharacterized protein n=1 Tax=Pristionchus pacificus TaxID=54126 RepID=A0A2A6CY54_PRIPA|nr:hypothetical protein PRIPAC_89211 [Pristionchus pacificus]|eukprot:PDM83105.1 hypothetical protein PRIPAC_37498 [Pristionchus pacificus]